MPPRPAPLVDTTLAFAFQADAQRVQVNEHETVTASLKMSAPAEESGSRRVISLEALNVPAGASASFFVLYSGGGSIVVEPASIQQAQASRERAIAFWEKAPLPLGRVQVPDPGIQALVDSSIRNIWQADTFWSPVIPVFDTLKNLSTFKDVTDYAQVMAPLVQNYEGLTNGWFILPLLAGATSFLQTRLSAPPTSDAPKKDNAQPSFMSGKTMQYVFPLVSVYICAISNALFSLYWITSNVASIISFWAVDKVLASKEAKAKEVQLT
jgi:hypothetical protein